MTDSILFQRPSNLGAIRVGMADIQLAPFGPTYADADRKANPSTKFFRMGTMQPGSVKTDLSKEFFTYSHGLPKVDYADYVIGQSGKLTATLDELTPYGIDVANGGYARNYTTTSSTTIKTATTPTASTLTLTSPTGYAAGNWIRITVASTGHTWDAQILTVDGATGAVVLVDPLPETPAALDAVVKITDCAIAIGGTKVTYYAARVVYADTSGDAHIWMFPKVSSRSSLAIDYQDGKNAILPVEFKIYGVQETFNSNTDQFLGYHWFIPKA